MEEKPNILFIVIDALRTKNLGCYGYSRSTSPNIDNLAKEGVMFEKAFSCATTTYPSLTTIFSGKYPLSHGITRLEAGAQLYRDAQRLEETGTVFLPEILKKEGYTTLAVDWLGRWLKRGYDYYSGILGPKKLRLYSWIRDLAARLSIYQSIAKPPMLKFQKFLQKHKINAEIITEEAMALIRKNHKKRFFLFIHYWDTHVPYNPPTHYIERFIGSDYGNHPSIEEVLSQLKPQGALFLRKRVMSGTKTVNEVLARYDGAIAYVDHEIGRLMQALENNGILDETLVVLTSDHGESLTEHGIYFCHHGLYDVTTHIPLIARYSGFPKNKKVNGLIQHTDVVPTILNVLGMKDEGLLLDGKDVDPLIHNEVDQVHAAAFLEEAATEHKRALRTNEYKYICALSEKDAMCKECGYIHGGVQELYDLNKDPEETRNIVEENPEEASKLRERLVDLVKLLQSERRMARHRKRKKAPWEYSAEEEKLIEKKLKELGYL